MFFRNCVIGQKFGTFVNNRCSSKTFAMTSMILAIIDIDCRK
jgi:hypothetical protein